MSESSEKKTRYNQKLERIAAFEKWLKEQPSRWKLFSLIAWARRMPK